LQNDQIKQGGEGDENGNNGQPDHPMDGEAAHEQVRSAVFDQRGGRCQQVNDWTFNGDGQTDDNPLRRQHDDLVRQPIGEGADQRPFGRHQQP